MVMKSVGARPRVGRFVLMDGVFLFLVETQPSFYPSLTKMDPAASLADTGANGRQPFRQIFTV